MPSKNRDLIKESVFKMALRYGMEKQAERLKLLVDDLDELKLHPNEIDKLLKIATQNNRFFPTLADILQPLQKSKEIEQEAEVDNAWDWFLANAFNPYKKLPDWAYTIKRHLGWSRIESCLSKNIPFVEKEFRELYKRKSDGLLHVHGDDRNWEKIGHTWALLPQGQFNDEEECLELI